MGDDDLYVMRRGWQSHPVFKPEPYTEREGWEWLISNAAKASTYAWVGKRNYLVERGNIVVSFRFLAAKWQWDVSHVRRFLDKLKNTQMVTAIDARASGESTQLTICNYEKFQSLRHTNGHTDDTQRGTQTDTKKKTHESSEPKGSSDYSARATSLPDGFEVPAAWLERAEVTRVRHRLPAVVLAVEAEKFVNYWLSQPTGKNRKKDWLRAWDYWILNARTVGNGRSDKTPRTEHDDDRGMLEGLSRGRELDLRVAAAAQRDPPGS